MGWIRNDWHLLAHATAKREKYFSMFLTQKTVSCRITFSCFTHSCIPTYLHTYVHMWKFRFFDGWGADGLISKLSAQALRFESIRHSSIFFKKLKPVRDTNLDLVFLQLRHAAKALGHFLKIQHEAFRRRQREKLHTSQPKVGDQICINLDFTFSGPMPLFLIINQTDNSS
jgi:hypothetical protein